MYTLLWTCLFAIHFSSCLVYAVDPTVKLDYATYRGLPYSNGITQWLGLRYAQAPVGNLRFAAPRPILPSSGSSTVLSAAQHGPICLGTNQAPPSKTASEDCLFLDIYAPSAATTAQKLPVYVFIQGGGFNGNNDANYDGTGIITASGMNVIVVTFNYRVGPYGFLTSKEIGQGGSFNNGLKDQRVALQWVRRYISNFGGDPSQVTLGGASAGAQSVILHLTAYGGRDDKLFARTAAESQSFPALRTVSECQYAYDALSKRLGCDKSADSLKCLRSIDAATLQTQNYNIPFPGRVNPPIYMYGPVLDLDFVSDYTVRALDQGKFVKVPAIYGDTTNEGTTFAPRRTSSQVESDNFLRDQFPKLTSDQVSAIASYYPVENTTTYANAGRFWRQASNAYGELRYICPGIATTRAYAARSVGQNWNYRWNVLDQSDENSGLGVSHVVELGAIWGPFNVHGAAPTSYYSNGANEAMVGLMQSYWTSFIRSGDPNTYRQAGAPVWRAWTSPDDYARLKLQTGQTAMESVPSDQRKRCEYLASIALGLAQ